jgi:hypothetical protein
LLKAKSLVLTCISIALAATYIFNVIFVHWDKILLLLLLLLFLLLILLVLVLVLVLFLLLALLLPLMLLLRAVLNTRKFSLLSLSCFSMSKLQLRYFY